MLIKTTLLAAALTLASGSAFAGTITNGDFSTGNLSGWSATSNVSVIPQGSSYAADLYAGGANVYTTISQIITLNAGDILTGWAQWLGHDYMPYNDNGFVKINGTSLFYGDISTFGTNGSSPVTSFSYTALSSGAYTLSAGVANSGDNVNSSELKVGGFTVTNNVPEPTAIALLGLGLAFFGFSGKKKSATELSI